MTTLSRHLVPPFYLQIGFKFNTKIMKEYTTLNVNKLANENHNYAESLRSKYSGLKGYSPVDVSRDRYSRLKYDSWRDKVAQLSRKKSCLQHAHKAYPSNHTATNKLQSTYQSLFDKKIGPNEQSSATITDRIHLKLKDMNNNPYEVPSLATRNVFSNRKATQQINGGIRDNRSQNLYLQEQPNPNKFDSPIKLLYQQPNNQQQHQQPKLTLQQRREENVLIKSNSPMKRSQASISFRPHQNMNTERVSNKYIISNVDQILAEIRKTLNK